MKVSPQHRILFRGARAEMLFGAAAVLVAATHLTGLATVEQVLPYGVIAVCVKRESPKASLIKPLRAFFGWVSAESPRGLDERLVQIKRKRL